MSVAVMLSLHIRYMCFFRLAAIDHAQTKWESMCGPWLQLQGMCFLK